MGITYLFGALLTAHLIGFVALVWRWGRIEGAGDFAGRVCVTVSTFFIGSLMWKGLLP